ncbi:hypothetical protein B0H63DRAFT_542289 [Podospora didyma]|uniref:Uncharacterized protein n=1 Tax=Podospora didyma TaxID=330526 RepID=A0AAE0U253_9PEZI|nr:hypothetical protein B0H63DRAFT_542289 [Podospora didyma]
MKVQLERPSFNDETYHVRCDLQTLREACGCLLDTTNAPNGSFIYENPDSPATILAHYTIREFLESDCISAENSYYKITPNDPAPKEEFGRLFILCATDLQRDVVSSWESEDKLLLLDLATRLLVSEKEWIELDVACGFFDVSKHAKRPNFAALVDASDIMCSWAYELYRPFQVVWSSVQTISDAAFRLLNLLEADLRGLAGRYIQSLRILDCINGVITLEARSHSHKDGLRSYGPLLELKTTKAHAGSFPKSTYHARLKIY